MASISKRDAARRQLNTAIRLFFCGEDTIVVHSLASSAANLYSDLVEQTTANESWRVKFQNNGALEEREVKRIINRAWNFFKHGDRDATDDLEFEETETELMLFYATLECGELEPTSDEMQLYQLWLLRTGRFDLELSGDINTAATLLFADLPNLERQAQIAKGLERFMALKANSDA